MEYDKTHWEQLIGVIIERIGPELFVEMSAYALQQAGYKRLGKYLEDGQFIAASAVRVIKAFGSGTDDVDVE
jgi:hypothetical protein